MYIRQVQGVIDLFCNQLKGPFDIFFGISTRSASSRVILRLLCWSSARSALFPTRILLILSGAYFLTSCSIAGIPSERERRSVKSKTSTTPWRPFSDAEVMLRNFSCPAVSSIWKQHCLPRWRMFVVRRTCCCCCCCCCCCYHSIIKLIGKKSAK